MALTRGGQAEQDQLMETSSAATESRFSRLMVPATTPGRLCLTGFAAGVLGFIAMIVSVGSGQEGGETFTDNWWISGPALVAALGLVGSFAIGVFAISRRRERAVPVVLATVIGAMVTLLLVGEFSTPH